ncbi:MAG: hypothetical protein DMF68_01615 [Acidobacteria bacterium]|nr:MAG: hypothetical protein DMF68_01615 [Acidobacteriota bacterium]
MRAQCDHCGQINDHVRPTRVGLKTQIICGSCRIELGVPDADDVEEQDTEFEHARKIINCGF